MSEVGISGQPTGWAHATPRASATDDQILMVACEFLGAVRNRAGLILPLSAQAIGALPSGKAGF